MLTERPTAPLSPPTSPRMSDTPAKATDYDWQAPSYLTTASQTSREEGAHEFERVTPTQGNVGDESQLHSRSHKGYPYSTGPSSRVSHETTSTTKPDSNEPSHTQQVVGSGSQPTGDRDLPTATFGGSAPTSPSGRLTPQSGENTQHDEQMLDDIDEDDLGPAEGDDEVDKSKMTPAELRAHKRKMKRFRYFTYNRNL
jgi:hypothetical protein